MFLQLVKRIANYYFQFFRKKEKIEILILDDLLPSQLSPWRNYEFEEILKNNASNKIVTDLRNYGFYNSGKSYAENIAELGNLYPNLSQRLHPLKLFENSNVKLVYTLFFENVKNYFLHFERNKMPFAFTLYPGGGFYLHNQEQNILLKRICQSEYFKGVIVNQNLLHRYLIENEICNSEKITLIHGVPLDLERYSNVIVQGEKFFEQNLNILFMANRYMQYGFDKGFDIFQVVMLHILKMYPETKVHVVGNFSENDISFKELEKDFIFHGSLKEEDFEHILSKTQICISPNRPNALFQGSFDGFPLGSSITAGLFKNALIITDPFNESEGINFADGQDFIKISQDPIEIIDKVTELIKNRNQLKIIATNGNKKLLEHYSFENQILPRLNFFHKILKYDSSH